MNLRRQSSRQWRRVAAACVLATATTVASTSSAAAPLIPPAPRSATNGALHYQRAILFLSAVDPDKREILSRPLWEIVTPSTPASELAELDALLNESRHAIRSALVGATQNEADFGFDVQLYLLGAYLPHTEAMTNLGRLIALDALRHQSAGEWEIAVQRLLLGVRMGRHLARQPTLLEALAAVDILEASYFALGNWAARCPDNDLVERTFQVVNAMASDMVNPARTLNFEASVVSMRLEALREAYPDGLWAEMILDAMGQPLPAGGAEAVRAAAIAAAVERGAPREIFDDKEAFLRHIAKVESAYLALATNSASCLALPAPASIKQAVSLLARSESKLPDTEYANSLNPVRTATYFAVHQTELDVLRVVLALAASRDGGRFPASLAQIAPMFGGEVPRSAYDGSELDYRPTADGDGFAIEAKAVMVGDVKLPQVGFVYEPAE